MNIDTQVILASQSPRRQELMNFLFDRFEVRVSDVDETLPEGIAPSEAVESLAVKKARAVAQNAPEAMVIGADTVVVIDGLIIGKPTSPTEAAAMLNRLSGRVHQVYTGVALCLAGKEWRFHCVTDVEFCPLTDREIAWYLETGEPFDKAGAYGIQGYGARFIKGIKGDYFNVMGLPVSRLYELLGVITK